MTIPPISRRRQFWKARTFWKDVGTTLLGIALLLVTVVGWILSAEMH